MLCSWVWWYTWGCTHANALAPVEQPQVYHHTQEQSMVEEQHGQGTVALDESYADESYDYGQYEGYDDGSGMVDTSGMAMGAADGNKDLATIEGKMLRVSNGWKCLDCEYEHIRKDLMLSHIQANHVDFPGYSCNICGKFSKTWVALKKHKTRNHRNIENA